MTEKRYSHDAIVIVDHLKKDLIYIEGKDDLLELAEYVDRLQEENEQLKQSIGVIYDLIDGYIALADDYRKPIESLTIGDELGYWNGVYQYMKKLKKRIGVL